MKYIVQPKSMQSQSHVWQGLTTMNPSPYFISLPFAPQDSCCIYSVDFMAATKVLCVQDFVTVTETNSV